MKLAKQIIPIAIVLLFLGMTITPALATAPIKEREPALDGSKVLTIWMPGPDGCKTQVQITEEQYNELNDGIDEFLVAAEVAIEDKTITPAEWNILKTEAIDAINMIKSIVGDTFPDIEVETFVGDIISAFINPFGIFGLRAPILSVGRGLCWIPFYDYEEFMGWMIRPMFIRYTIGFAGVFHVNPFPFRLEYMDRLGMFRLRTIGFGGLFINWGDLGVDTFKGTVLVIGKSWNKLGEDLP